MSHMYNARSKKEGLQLFSCQLNFFNTHRLSLDTHVQAFVANLSDRFLPIRLQQDGIRWRLAEENLVCQAQRRPLIPSTERGMFASTEQHIITKDEVPSVAKEPSGEGPVGCHLLKDAGHEQGEHKLYPHHCLPRTKRHIGSSLLQASPSSTRGS